MKHRGQFTRSERSARSRLAKLLHEEPFVCGSLVTMHRLCGKKGCKCSRGEPHRGLYLAMRVGEKRKMVYVPQTLETTVRRWVATYQEAWQLMEEISQACLGRFVRTKQNVGHQGKANKTERD